MHVHTQVEFCSHLFELLLKISVNNGEFDYRKVAVSTFYCFCPLVCYRHMDSRVLSGFLLLITISSLQGMMESEFIKF